MKYALCACALLWATAALAQAPDPSPPGWTLQATLQRAGDASLDVQQARLGLSAARADVQTAAVTPAPVLSLNSQAIDPNHFGGGSLWHRQMDTIVRLDKTLERGDKAALRERNAQAGADAARQDLLSTVRARRVAAAQAYWDLKLAQEQDTISARNSELAQASARVARLRLQQGDLSRLEATRLAVEAERAANEQAQSQVQLVSARQTLRQVLALDGPAAVALQASDAWPGASDVRGTALSDPAANDERWLEARPEVQAAVMRVAQAQAQVDLAEAQRRADVTVGVQYEHYPAVGNHLWGVGVSIPLGVDGRQAGPVARALATLESARVQLAQLRAGLRTEHAVLLSTLQAAQARVQRLETALLPQAREALQSAEFARQQGALPLQDVLDARRSLHAAELDAATAHADLAKALAALTLTSEPETVTP